MRISDWSSDLCSADLFLQRDDLAPEIDFLLRWREHAVDDVDVGRLGAAERTEIADVAVLDQEVLKALQIVQRVPVAADRPLHPGRTAVQDDLLTYVERLRALAGPLVADRTRRVAIGKIGRAHV